MLPEMAKVQLIGTSTLWLWVTPESCLTDLYYLCRDLAPNTEVRLLNPDNILYSQDWFYVVPRE